MNKLLAAVILTALVALPVDAGVAGKTDSSTPIGVSEREFTISLYRTKVPAGRVRFNVRNFGEDGHNLVVSGPGPAGPRHATSPEIEPGDTHTLRTRLPEPGTYRLACTLADHKARGMRAKLVVSPR